MPRPRRPGAPEPKRRSRKGCWPCKARKVKCGEEKPSCVNCERQGEVCDYSIRLNWDGRSKRTSSVGSSNSPGDFSSHVMSFSLPSVDSAGTDISTGQPPDSSGAPADNRSPDQTPLTPASYPVLIGGLHDSPVANNRPDHLGYGSKKSPTMSPPSQTQGMSATWDHTAPFPAHQEPLDGTPYPSPEDTNSSIASLNTFGFTPTSVSQPTSFLRQSVDVDYASERDTWPDRLPKRARLQPPFSADPFGVYGRDGPSESSRECNAHPLDTGVPMLPGIGQEIPNSSPSASTPAGEIFAKLVDEQLAPSASPGDSCASTIERPPIQKGADSGLTGSVSNAKRKWKDYLSNVEDNYGLDCGRPDLDLNKNDDHAAIDVNSALKSMIPGRRTSHTGQYSSRNTEYAYYASPVPINIPRHLSPLPSLLLDNPINLMYFHHYINHTARILIPHDCENNPFSSVMPSSKSSPTSAKIIVDMNSGHFGSKSPEPAVGLFRQSPCTMPGTPGTGESNRTFGERRFSKLASRVRRPSRKHNGESPRHGHDASLAEDHLPQYLRGSYHMAEPLETRP